MWMRALPMAPFTPPLLLIELSQTSEGILTWLRRHGWQRFDVPPPAAEGTVRYSGDTASLTVCVGDLLLLREAASDTAMTTWWSAVVAADNRVTVIVVPVGATQGRDTVQSVLRTLSASDVTHGTVRAFKP